MRVLTSPPRAPYDVTKFVAKESSWIHKPVIRLGSETVRDAYGVGTGWRRNPRGGTAREAERWRAAYGISCLPYLAVLQRAVMRYVRHADAGSRNGSAMPEAKPDKGTRHEAIITGVAIFSRTDSGKRTPIASGPRHLRLCMPEYGAVQRGETRTAACDVNHAMRKPCRAFRIGRRPMPGRSAATLCAPATDNAPRRD